MGIQTRRRSPRQLVPLQQVAKVEEWWSHQEMRVIAQLVRAKSWRIALACPRKSISSAIGRSMHTNSKEVNPVASAPKASAGRPPFGPISV